MINKYKVIALVVVLVLSSIGITFFLTESLVRDQQVVTMSVDIDGPDNSPAGEMVEYKINPKNLPWFTKDPHWQWKVIESNSSKVYFREAWDSQSVWFTPHRSAKKYYVIASGSAIRDIWIHKWQTLLGVYVKEVSVGDQPNPEPGPHPSPHNIPEGKFGISAIAYEFFPEKYSYLAKQIEENYTGIASSINAGALTRVEEIFTKLRENNQETLKRASVEDKVFDTWNSKLKDRIKKVYDEKKLTQVNNYGDLLNEIALGLTYVR